MLIVVMSVGIALVLAALAGWSMAESSMSARSRRQARRQQQLNDEWRALVETKRHHRPRSHQ